MAIDKKETLTHAVTFKNFSDYFQGGLFFGFFVCLFQKKKKFGLFRNSQFHLSLEPLQQWSSHCNLYGFDVFAAKFTQKF